MIVIKLQGGLGNQMFQYAFAKQIEKITGQDISFDLAGFDTLPGVTKREYELKKSFDVNLHFIPTAQSRAFQSQKNNPTISRLKKLFGIRVPQYIQEETYSTEKVQWQDDVYLDGYWQSEEYFNQVTSDIQKIFTSFSDALGQEADTIAHEIKKETCAVSLQVRRGDYITLKKVSDVLCIQSVDYYLSAIDFIAQKVNTPLKIFVFSDDIEWVKNNITIPYEVTYVSNPNIANHEAITLASLCRHNIVSNSTFGWWGAWLNKNREKIVVAPQSWFKGNPEKNKKITPRSWIRF